MITYSGMHDHTVLGSWFRRLDVRRWTWYSNDGFTKKEIDHFLTRQRDRGLIKSYRTVRSAESPANSDHVLLVAELSLTLLKPRKTPSLPWPDVARLVQDAELQDLYNITVQNKFASSLGALPDDLEESWTSFSHVIRSSAEEVIGPARRVRIPWLSTDTIAVLEEKAKAKIQNNTVQRKRLQGVFKARAKHDREVFLNNLCDELETDIGQNCLGPAFKVIRLLSGKRKVIGTTIHKSDGSPCLSEEETHERWCEHFISALNHHPGVPSNELDNEAASTPVDTSVSIDEPSVEEVYAAIKRLRNGHAPGPDGIPPELLKCAIRPVAHALHSIFLSVWRTGKMPTDWKDRITVTLYKGKGPKSECSNYRPITLLSVPGKVFAHVILARIQPLLDRTRRPQQSGFTTGAAQPSMPSSLSASCSLAVLDPRVGHTMDVLSPFIPVLCHSD